MKKEKPAGIVTELQTAQSACLRTVCGAYKATPVKQLETEASVPPLHIYLDKRVAETEERFTRTGYAEFLQEMCTKVNKKVAARKASARSFKDRRGCRADAADIPLKHTPRDKQQWHAEWQKDDINLEAAMEIH